MMMDAPEQAAPKGKRATKAREASAPPPAPAPVPASPSASASPTAGWSAERWGTAVAARVYVELHRAHAAELRDVDPQVRRSLGRVIRQEVERAIAESVADAMGARS